MVETEIAETEITETEVVETEVTETEIVESPSTNGSDTVETESDPSNTEMVVPVSVISAAVTAVSIKTALYVQKILQIVQQPL